MRHINAGLDSGDGSGANLLPVLAYLEAQGNRSLSAGFADSPGGIYCRMADPLDFDALLSEFTFDERISLDRDGDEIFDTTSDVSIYGQGYVDAMHARRAKRASP